MLDAQSAFANLATSKKRKDDRVAAREIEESRALQDAIRTVPGKRWNARADVPLLGHRRRSSIVCPRCPRSARLGGDRAMVGLGDEKGAVGLGRRYRLAPPLDLRRRQCREYLLLVAFDALRAGYDRD
jgi:hypothetical protein